MLIMLLPELLAGLAESTLLTCWSCVRHCARFQVDLARGDFNAFSYRYYKSGSQQIAASLQDSSLAVMLRRFDEGINAQDRGRYDNQPEHQFRSDIYVTYHDEHIVEYRLMRDAILDEVTDAAGESSKIPRQNRYWRERTIPEAKSSIIKNKYAVRYLADQEKMCRLAQRITLSCSSSDSVTKTCTEF